METVLREHEIVGGEDVMLYTGTLDNEDATALSVDFQTTFVDSVQCVVHTLHFAVNDVYKEEAPCQICFNQVNYVTSYFKYHSIFIYILIIIRIIIQKQCNG